MSTPPVPDDVIRRTLDAMEKCGGNQCAAAGMLGISRGGLQGHLRMAARRGMLSPGNATEVMQGFEITRVQTGPHGTTIEQKPEPGKPFEMPEGHRIKGFSVGSAVGTSTVSGVGASTAAATARLQARQARRPHQL